MPTDTPTPRAPAPLCGIGPDWQQHHVCCLAGGHSGPHWACPDALADTEAICDHALGVPAPHPEP